MEELFPTSIITERRCVENSFPVLEPHPYRIAIVGEAPGEKEEDCHVPFVGPSGSYLNAKLHEAGIDRNRCFVGNISQVRPPGNKIELFKWDGPEIQNGLRKLTSDLAQFDPNICVLLGNTPLRAARGPSKIFSWRGSLFRGTVSGPFFGRKCIGSLHPAFVLREFSGNPLLGLDLQRARADGENKDLVLPKRELLTDLTVSHLLLLMDTWPSGLRCSVDIEGGLPPDKVNEGVKKDAKKRRHLNWKCVALSASPMKAFVIQWWKFNEVDHARLLASFARLMYRTDVPKVLQNSLYDNFVLTYGYGVPIRNIAEDTMLKGWEVFSELPKGLSVQASIWTREPHWKDEEMYDTNGENLAEGCCKDVAVTLEICNAQDGALSDRSEYPHGLEHYRTNIEMLQPALYMELRGMKLNQENVTKEIEETINGYTNADSVYHKGILQIAKELTEIAGEELRGPKGSLSADKLADCLYQIQGRTTRGGKAKVTRTWKNSPYPPQYAKENGRKTDKLTTDKEAILTLGKRFPNDPFLAGILEHRHLEGILETLNVKADPDGRVRCAYNVVGTETGRFSCKTSPTGSGANMTTITKKLRHNYVSDPGFDFFQLDLAGADGWTVAAHCARLGDNTMLDDYKAGLKPAKILALLYAFGSDVNKLDRESLLWWSKKDNFKVISQLLSEGIYDACKAVQHGSNYLGGVPTMATTIMMKSFKESGVPLYIDHATMKVLQDLYFSRYRGLRTWHQWSEAQVTAIGTLTSATGHTRVLMGRRHGKDITDTVKEYLADEPQQNTTWATNLAMLNLWNDPENRYKGLVLKDAYDTYMATLRGEPGALFIEPLHQVHDALCGQSPTANRLWAAKKLTQWFNNPLTIAGIPITIPFEGAFGPSWGETNIPL